jgi:hypothetical protein
MSPGRRWKKKKHTRVEAGTACEKRVGNKYLGSKDEHHGGGSAQLRAHKAEQIFDVGPGPGEDEQAERESRRVNTKRGGGEASN